MDYTKLPRSLIYKERKSLKDFGVHIEGTLNHYLFMRMARMTLLRTGDSEQIALQCLNNAYYICTLILLDEFPYLKMDKYEEKLLKETIPFPNDVYQASMALVCVLLAAYDDKYKKEDNILIENIYHWTSSNKWTGSLSHNSFVNIIKECRPDGFSLSQVDLAPRDIIEVIETFGVRNLQVYAEYICERLALMENPRQRMYGADMAIAKVKDYLRMLREDCGYNPKKDCFGRTNDIPSIRNLEYENIIRDNYRQGKEAIDYYTKHYPTKDENDSKEKTAETTQTSETGALQKEMGEQESKQNHQVLELKQKIAEKDQALQKALQIIEEYRQPVKELTAKQKIRMEFAVQLLLKAGLAEENLDKENRNKSKVASLLSLLLDIKPTICANFLVDRKYYPQEKDRDTILELDKLCLELGVNAHLSTQQQGNKK